MMEVMVSFSGDSPPHPDRPVTASETTETPLDPAATVKSRRWWERPIRWGRVGIPVVAACLIGGGASLGPGMTPLRPALPLSPPLRPRTHVPDQGLDRPL